MSTEPEPPEEERNRSARPDVERREESWPSSESRPLGIAAGLGLGLLLILASCRLCAAFQSAVPLALGVLIAFATLFDRKTRMIFVGFAILILLTLLVLAIICGNMRIK